MIKDGFLLFEVNPDDLEDDVWYQCYLSKVFQQSITPFWGFGKNLKEIIQVFKENSHKREQFLMSGK
jgi:hypothetical protein